MNTHLVVINPGFTADDLLDQMRAMRQVRVDHPKANVVCTLTGFSSDHRPLAQIPEAVETCRRLVAIGFVSYLDVSTQVPKGHPEPQTFGALEAWMTSKGTDSFSPKVFMEFWSELKKFNDVADKMIGPME